MQNSTDWTKYYQGRKNLFSSVTQKITAKKLLCFIKKYRINTEKTIELGGGNSCFMDYMCTNCDIKQYDVLDNNEFSISKMSGRKNCKNAFLESVIDGDLKTKNDTDYDFVYSIGLVEHFNHEQTLLAIQNHFNLCKTGGYVIISFPTPTRQYQFFRKCIECVGKWIFVDEEPLFFEDVKSVFEENSEVILVYLNKHLPLTQTIVCARKN